MNELKVDLENCYGISKLKYDFDFGPKNAFIIYASNGFMKTSFTKTVSDLCKGKTPKEEIFNRKTYCKIVDENENQITDKNTFVVKSYDESYSSKNVSTLLVQEDLKKAYDRVTKQILEHREKFVCEMNSYYSFGKSLNFEDEFNSTYSCDDMLKGLEKIIDYGISNAYYLNFDNIPYSDLFNDKVKKFVDENYKDLFDYATEYDKLMMTCTYFKRGEFNQYNAENVSTALDENGYFAAGHKLTLNDNNQINSIDDFNKLIEDEKKKVFGDKKLQSKFNKVSKNLSKNAQLRNFRKIIENNLYLISELVQYDAFKMKCWNGIIEKHYDEIKNLVLEYKNAKQTIEEIQIKAKKQKHEWDHVIEIFKNRFHVPFSVSIGNKEDVVLKNSVPVFEFVYEDKFNNEKEPIERGKLNDLLSGGERRSLYLMNIIFELEALKKNKKNTLIVCDDIAESFDYKNKHAIIEYLYENYNCGYFKFIILTHNFDFFRTVSSRLLGNDRNYCLMANPEISNNEIKLLTGDYLNNVFDYWHKRINKNKNVIIAVIPFIRNIIEYTKSNKHPDYILLTTLLHYKKFDENPTDKITLKVLNDVIRKLWNDVDIFKKTDLNPNNTVFELIIEESIKIINEKEDTKIKLEDKIVMSIACRLIGEKLLVDNLLEKENCENEIKSIEKNQTGVLLDMYKKTFGKDDELLKIVEPIALFATENIHLNSFMYEPLIDTSPNELRKVLGTLLPNIVDQEQKIAI